MRTTFQASPKPPHRPDDEAADVHLPPAQAMGRRAREGVVVVVPGLAERGDREPEHVGRLVVRREAPAAEEVADRVDREGHVVDQEDAHEARPEERRNRSGEPTRQRQARRERDRKPERHPEREQPADDPHAAVLEQIGCVLLRLDCRRMVEEPAHVGVPQAPERADLLAVLADVRAVRIALLVGEGVVAAVVRHPADHGALDRHRAENGEQVLDRLEGLEGAVGQQAVEADGDAGSRQEVHDHEQRQVERADPLVPQQRDGCEEGDERQHDGRDVDVAMRPGHGARDICT